MAKQANEDMQSSCATPTMFLQADTKTFKEIVQILTGKIPPPAAILRQPAKLQERRNQSIHKLDIKRGLESMQDLPIQNSPMKRKNLGFNSPVEGPGTPLGCESELYNRIGGDSPPSEEERVIAERGFYLHHSPYKAEPPRLLTLFPLTSPRQEP